MMIKSNNSVVLKICFVNPRLEGPYPPLGLAYLAAYLEKYSKHRFIMKIIDGNCVKDVLRQVIDFNPAIVGFTALSPQIQEAVDLSNELKSEKPNIFQVIGGLHVSAEPIDTLRRGSFDIAVLGEGEEIFKDIVDVFVQYGLERNKYSRINSVAFLNNGQFFQSPPRQEIEDLDSIPFPKRSLLNMKHYLSKYLVIRGLSGDKVATVHASRGCPYDCVFCSCGIVFKKVRYFSVDYVISEIKELTNDFGIKSIFFTDDTFVLNKERVKKLCLRFIEEGLHKKIRWEVQGRANLINWNDLELLKLMKQAGCLQVDYGFETGSDRILKFLKKKDVSIDFNKRAIEITKAAGLNVMGTFMVGIPGETEEDMEQTKKFITDNINKIDNFQVFVATPYPGAELYRICRENNTVEGDYFLQLKKERGKDFIHCYTRTISCQKVVDTQRFLNKLAARKITLNQKLSWLIFNLLRNPLSSLEKIYSVIKK